MKRKLLAILSAVALIGTSLSPSISSMAAPKETKAVGTTYYVSTLDGNDKNDGKSESNAFYSLDKINDIVLQPGDKVLLEAGSVFENGYLHLQGSGTEENPIVVGKYGEGNLPRINTNGQGIWYQNYRGGLDSTSHKWQGYVSSSVLLYDVEYVTVKDLEITNKAPDIETKYNALDTMNRTGVAAVAQNKGTVDNIHLDNLYIHDVVGNVYDKHMNNGGIYFTVFQPVDEASTGVAKYDDVLIENCYLDTVNRWGIAVGYSYTHPKFTPSVIPDDVINEYGSTNVVIRNNYIKDAGGDSITTMYCDRPLIEYNVSDGAAWQINNTHYTQSGAGKAAAGIWPWKCKDPIFQYNECFDMQFNQDAQAWDADSGDGCIYQYNYSHDNDGGAVMFCLQQSINNIFRYNISQNDLDGVMNPCGTPSAHVYNNTFYMKEGVPFIRPSMRGGTMLVENNIIYYSGETPKAKEEWHTGEGGNKYNYRNNLYYNYVDIPADDTAAVVVAKGTKVMENPGNGPTGPTDITAGAITSDKKITHDLSAFDGYKLCAGSPAINAGKVIANNGGKDFFGNPIVGLPDIGAAESDVVALNRDNAIKESSYMIKDNTIFVPMLEKNPTTVAELRNSIKVDATASFKVMNGTTEVTSGNVAGGMKVVVTAENGDTREYTITAKNTYQWALDYAGPQQGNVWFGQIRNSATEYADMTNYDSTYPQWVIDTYYGPGVDLPNHSTPTDENTHGLLSDTTGASKKAGIAMAFRAPKSGKVTVAVKDNEPYLRQDGNANGSVTLSFTKNGEVLGDTYTLEQSKVKADVGVRTVEVQKGDWIRVEAKNNGNPSRPTIHVTPIITYVDDAYEDQEAPEPPTDVEAGEIEETSATISWTEATDDVAVVKYQIFDQDGNKVGETTDTTYTVTGLEAGTEYTFTVKAVDASGKVSEAVEVNFKTAEEPVEPTDTEAPTAPTEVKATNVGKTSATISWKASTDNVGVVKYVVSYDGKSVDITDPTVTSLNLVGLKAGTEYTVSVVAYDAAGNASEAGTKKFTTEKDEKPVDPTDKEAPTAPTEVEASNVGKTSATISWKASTDNVGVERYVVSYGEVERELADTNITLYDLKAGTTYTVSVVAYDKAGNASKAGTVEFTTEKDEKPVDPTDKEAPTAPTEVKASNVGKTSATISWKASTDNKGVVKYVVTYGDKTVETTKTSVKLDKLSAGKQYEVSVVAYDAAGNASKAGTVKFTTEKEPAKQDKPNSPTTGDNMSTVLPIIMLLLAAGAVATVFVVRRKRKI